MPSRLHKLSGNFWGLGVTVIFDKENISTADFADEFLLNILSGVAEEESRQTSTNIRWSVGKKMSKGGNTTRRIYGYKIIDNEFHIVPEEAEIVKLIYDWYKNHVSYAQMIKRLEATNIKTPFGNSKWPVLLLKEFSQTRNIVETHFRSQKH